MSELNDSQMEVEPLKDYNEDPIDSELEFIEDLESEKKIYDRYIEAYNKEAEKDSNNKTHKEEIDRCEVINQSESIEPEDGVEVITTDDDIPEQFSSAVSFTEKQTGEKITDLFDFFSKKIRGNATTNLPEFKHIVHISNDTANNVLSERGVDDESKGDKHLRDDDEDDTGQFSEVAFEKLASKSMDWHTNLDIKSIPDEVGAYAGDFVVNGYIMELKSCKSESKGQNITHRNHQHPTTGTMYIKSGIASELYGHSVVLDLREFGMGVIVAFLGLTPSLPEHGGVFGSEVKTFNRFIVNYVNDLSWYGLTDYGWHRIKNKIETIEL